MRELSMHILDLAQNSIAAGAKRVEIEVAADTKADVLTISISDDGRGMSEQLLNSARDPFTTTRTTRRVGLGIPMFEEAAAAAGGGLTLKSEEGKGTLISASFKLSNVDRAPLGNIAETIMAIVAANPEMSIKYVHRMDGTEFIFDTNDVKDELEGVPINNNFVLKWLYEFIKSGTGRDMEIN